MNINEYVAKRILELRKSKGLTAELSKSCVSYAEKGQTSIKISTINSICDITLAEFFSVFDKQID